MNHIEYVDLQTLNRVELLNILNNKKVRKHLISHGEFNVVSLDEWVKSKIRINSTSGCKIKGVKINAAVAGWCGIQYENGAYELAIVLDANYWGVGVAVFKELMKWAGELDHRNVVLHLFNTRPEYKFLRKMASRVDKSTVFGQEYTRYELRVPGA